MTNLLKVCALGILAFGLSACDKVSDAVDSASKAVDSATQEGKKIAKALSIESPLLTIELTESGDPYFVIQSQDNNTIIEDIIVNRGNCSVMKYIKDGDMARAYRELNGDYLKTKNGEDVNMAGSISSNIYNALDADSKAVYKKRFPIKLPYSKMLIVWRDIGFGSLFGISLNDVIITCNTNDIIEIELIVNGGGSYIFKPKEMLLF